MKNRLTKNLLTGAILFIFFIFVFIQACGPTPAVEITDATQTPITRLGTYRSEEPILGSGTATLIISSLRATSVQVSLNGGSVTLTNISGQSGRYTYGNNEMTLSVSVADADSITVNLTRLKAPYLLLENIACYTTTP